MPASLATTSRAAIDTHIVTAKQTPARHEPGHHGIRPHANRRHRAAYAVWRDYAVAHRPFA
ncbi:MAG: hypothetical protein DWQ31_03540 [Planctomycetota bacterium]|nr:MAG: hypothetical protein DWQ31_03540 [Planctomycetota bacterium]REJ93961.1 MAG: hypothetical protein DWQ35_09330 [Planctomycetota bacterium]REK30941.1 MAG: hypothetical protein DWQ42_01155 [Planctomycetota bacterium]REK38193.1 MAG: hypothetical protein DWQ46_20890 [Planctomycetota bacterium]